MQASTWHIGAMIFGSQTRKEGRQASVLAFAPPSTCHVRATTQSLNDTSRRKAAELNPKPLTLTRADARQQSWFGVVALRIYTFRGWFIQGVEVRDADAGMQLQEQQRQACWASAGRVHVKCVWRQVCVPSVPWVKC